MSDHSVKNILITSTTAVRETEVTEVAFPNTDFDNLTTEPLYKSTNQILNIDECNIDIEETVSTTPFVLNKVYGVNRSTALLNLDYNEKGLIFYASSNNGVLFDRTKNETRFLQGHKNNISNISSDLLGLWIVTADSGEDNVVNIWNSETCDLHSSISSPHGLFHLNKVRLSRDAEFLLTFAYENDPTINIWNWRLKNDTPMGKHCIKTNINKLVDIIFNPNYTEEFCIATDRDIIFGVLDKDSGSILTKNCPIRSKHNYGTIKCLTYANNKSYMFVSTNKGFVGIYKLFNDNSVKKKFIKLVKVDSFCIKVIKECDGLVVTGNENGVFKIFNMELKIQWICDNLDINKLRVLCFTLAQKKDENVASCLKKHGDLKAQIIRDAYVYSDVEGIGLINLAKGTYTKVISNLPANITAIAAHPERKLICLGDTHGGLKLVDYSTQSVAINIILLPTRMKHHLKKDEITCLKYSPAGTFLACGDCFGTLRFLNPILLSLMVDPFDDSNFPISHIVFSQDSTYCAFSDTGFTVILYKYNCEEKTWNMIGKHRAHYMPIIQILFTLFAEPMLLTFGSDRYMNEYKIEDSRRLALTLKSSKIIEHKAIPITIIDYPYVEKERNLLIMASDDYKIKVLNYSTGCILATYLSPIYSSPVKKMMAVGPNFRKPQFEFIIFQTDECMGIQILPLDGNPHKATGMLGHPIQILDLIITRDGASVFTIGKNDNCVCQWSLNLQLAEREFIKGGTELTPYLNMIHGGPDSWFLKRIKTIFYHVQILCQGSSTPFEKYICETIKVSTIPDIMRTLGYFPTDEEIKRLITEVNHRVFNESVNTDVTFNELVILYINYRPAFGESYDNFHSVFNTLAESVKDGTFRLNRKKFTNMADTSGYYEKPTIHSLKLLASLIKRRESSILGADAGKYNFLPETMSFDYFIHELMGVVQDKVKDEYENIIMNL